MKALVGIGIFIHLVVGASMFTLSDLPMVVPCVFSSLALVSLVGGLLVPAGYPRTGAWLVFVASVAFFPVGVVAMAGAREVLDATAA